MHVQVHIRRCILTLLPLPPQAPPIAAAIIPNLPHTLRALCTARALSALDTASKAHAAMQHPKQQQQHKMVNTSVNTPASPKQHVDPLEAMCTAVLQLVNTQENLVPAPTHMVNDGEETAVEPTLTTLQQLIETCARATSPHLAARAATLARLLRWLQLYTLADPQLLEGGLLTELTAVVNALEEQTQDETAAPDVAVGGKRPGAGGHGSNSGGATKRARIAATAAGNDKDTTSDEQDDASDDDEEETKAQQQGVWQDQLVDVVLSLLSYNGAAPEGSSLPGLPSAPLRDAVERVFRAHCRLLTSQGLEDLLRVVVQVWVGGVVAVCMV